MKKNSYYRSTHCWSCRTPIDNERNIECPICGWIICPICGACAFDCIGRAVLGSDEFTKQQRDLLRSKWKSMPTKPQNPLVWARDEVSLNEQKWRSEYLSELESRRAKALFEREAEEAKERALKAAEEEAHNLLWQRLLNGDTVYRRDGHFGVFHSSKTDSSGNFTYFKIVFDDNSLTEYWFPKAFDDGFLSFVKN